MTNRRDQGGLHHAIIWFGVSVVLVALVILVVRWDHRPQVKSSEADHGRAVARSAGAKVLPTAPKSPLVPSRVRPTNPK